MSGASRVTKTSRAVDVAVSGKRPGQSNHKWSSSTRVHQFRVKRKRNCSTGATVDSANELSTTQENIYRRSSSQNHCEDVVRAKQKTNVFVFTLPYIPHLGFS